MSRVITAEGQHRVDTQERRPLPARGVRQGRESRRTLRGGPAYVIPERPAAPIERVFNPAELDLDDLAEAIRVLLGPDNVAQIATPGRPDPDLLIPRPGVSHVVEATQAP